MSKNFLAFFCLLCVGASAFSMPARQTPIAGLSGQGEPVEVTLHGDENFHFYTDECGTLLMRRGDTFVPAQVAPDGTLVASSARRQVAAERTSLQRGAAMAAERRNVPGLVPTATFPARGEQPVLVVLVEYQDVKFNLPDPHDYFSRMLNEPGFSDYWATGSARDWFLHSSAGQFSPHFDVYGPVTLQKSRSFYGGNDAFGQDVAPQKMAVEACRTLNPDVDFSEYDCDGDGYIDNVFVVYAGRGEASGGPEESVWPHAWTLNSAEPGSAYSFDGVKLNRYACSNEWELSDLGHGMRPVGIGTFIHEFSHVMGLPDLYSTAYVEGTFTAGPWSAMDYGPYNNDGCTPPQYSAWERASLGYLDLPLLPEKGNVGLPLLENGGAYLIPSASENEFYVMEHRAQSGWDAFIPASGMLLWHIDYDPEIWRTNQVNNDPAHNHVDIIEADGTRENSSRAGDCFPGTEGVTSIDPRLWNGMGLGYPLSDITLLPERIALRVNGGEADIATPTGLAVTEIAPGSISAKWDAVEGAQAYVLTLTGEEQTRTQIVKDATNATFSSLTPDTQYTLIVRADDGAFGSAESAPVAATTLPPTLDYLQPRLLQVTDQGTDYFLAQWEEMPLASDYLLSVWQITEGDRPAATADFTDGVESLPAGFSTNSAATYAMASYSGEAIPSLRFSRQGDYLLFESDRPLHSLSFWHRANGIGSGEKLLIESANETGGEWETVATQTPTDEKGGATITVPLDGKCHAVRILFHRPEKGSVAIDDVRLSLGGDDVETPLAAYTLKPIGDTSHRVEGLASPARYSFQLQGRDGSLLSLPSEKGYVTLSSDSGLSLPASEKEYTLCGRLLSCPVPFEVYSASGMCLCSGVRTFTLPASGLYFLRMADGETYKLITN